MCCYLLCQATWKSAGRIQVLYFLEPGESKLSIHSFTAKQISRGVSH
uniref:Uncharacterized protein n=1 Tax=Arundo donax TaxID=35708 RepID=A0A0A8Z3I7_ARUDO